MRLPSLSAVPQTFLCSGAQTWANLLLLPPQLSLSPSPPSPCLFTAPPPSNLSVPFNFPQPPERRTRLNHSPLLFFSRRLSRARVHVRGSAAPLRRFARAPFRSLCKRRSRRRNKKPEPHLRARRKKSAVKPYSTTPQQALLKRAQRTSVTLYLKALSVFAIAAPLRLFSPLPFYPFCAH